VPTYHLGMATYGAAPEGDGGLQALFESTPEPGVHTSAAAELGFLFGLVALAAAPFSVTHGLTLGIASAAAMLGFIGVVTTSNPYVAGRALAPAGLAFALVALALVGLRYVGLDTAFGDELLPVIGDWLDKLNTNLPTP
jgi:drug/metabolite transporter (DMT)-like permease